MMLYLVSGLMLFITSLYAQAQPEPIPTNQIKIELEQAPTQLTTNEIVTIRFRLLKNNKRLTFNDLKEVHTQKIHVLAIDQSLSDYHHIHPMENRQKENFVFHFTPKHTGTYRIWVDVTSLDTEKQEFLVADVGQPSSGYAVKEEEIYQTAVGPYQFHLELKGNPKAGQNVMATLTVTQKGKPFTGLEPIMGSFAHLVGFSADRSSVVHIHPMGKEPQKNSDREGPQLMFHMALKQRGMIKLFSQVRIHGKEMHVPFSIRVT